MILQTIVYTDVMEASVAWWSTVLRSAPDHESDIWTTFDLGDAVLALHHIDAVPSTSRIAVSLVVDDLDDRVEELTGHGLVPDGDLVEQPFGRQVPYRDPVGNVVMVNEHR